MHYTNLLAGRGILCNFIVLYSSIVKFNIYGSIIIFLSWHSLFLYVFLQIFFLGGRLIFGPDVRSLIATVCLIVIPVIVFAAVVPQQLANGYQNQIGGWVASVSIIFTAYVSQ
jgi:hypothetical protein